MRTKTDECTCSLLEEPNAYLPQPWAPLLPVPPAHHPVALFCLAVGRNLEGINVAYVDADRGERKLHCPGVVMSWCTINFVLKTCSG